MGTAGAQHPKFKTKLCQYYLDDKYFHGGYCNFSHDESAFDEHGRLLGPNKEPSLQIHAMHLLRGGKMQQRR